MPRVTTLNTYYTFFRLVVWVAVQESNIESKTAAMELAAASIAHQSSKLPPKTPIASIATANSSACRWTSSSDYQCSHALAPFSVAAKRKAWPPRAAHVQPSDLRPSLPRES